MLAKSLSYGLSGISGFPVTVEVNTAFGIPSFDAVGLPDAADPGTGALRPEKQRHGLSRTAHHREPCAGGSEKRRPGL